ncbi:hypothetical protein [Candidatus Nitrosotenuis sp. DW1]|uniref:hypothetical protein n=1 Tax=Candidatus Nitrosotenuis sp. DW1 TaxID=2259672 RepID=UPI0015CB2AAE|nr:hypothetical protein [Candidatus Nitrosotenuis sp. DW1]QLH09440.1 hypothetical protein DSQ19_08115 [Candidatus Nitrosotenuis sp. DW1]
MTTRKGQFIVNYLRGMNFKDSDVGRVLHSMSDEDFDRIESLYRTYSIAVMHNSPNLNEINKEIEECISQHKKEINNRHNA